MLDAASVKICLPTTVLPVKATCMHVKNARMGRTLTCQAGQNSHLYSCGSKRQILKQSTFLFARALAFEN